MKRLGFCLLFSLALHALFFPEFLHAMLTSGAADQAPKTPARTQIRMVAKAKKPEPPPEVKKLTPQRPKPKVVREKPPQAKPERPAPERPRPTERPRSVAQQPQERPRSRPRTAERPRTSPKESGRASAPPPNSRKRLTRGDRATRPTRGPEAGVPPSSEESGGKTGYLPSNGQNTDLGSTEFNDNSNQSGDDTTTGNDAGSNTNQSTDPGTGGNNQPPDDNKEGNDTKENQDNTQRDEKKEEKKEETKSSLARKANASVPSVIKLPKSLRRDNLNLSLQVRVEIGPDGSADFKLGQSSGNPEADDFILNEVRRIAQVTTALDEQGQPKRATRRFTVKIEVN